MASRGSCSARRATAQRTWPLTHAGARPAAAAPSSSASACAPSPADAAARFEKSAATDRASTPGPPFLARAMAREYAATASTCRLARKWPSATAFNDATSPGGGATTGVLARAVANALAPSPPTRPAYSANASAPAESPVEPSASAKALTPVSQAGASATHRAASAAACWAKSHASQHPLRSASSDAASRPVQAASAAVSSAAARNGSPIILDASALPLNSRAFPEGAGGRKSVTRLPASASSRRAAAQSWPSFPRGVAGDHAAGNGAAAARRRRRQAA
mmetsp:Transcript_36116/g.110760  ORF Transcript_36116/g.110760 Transcript_36116/m.110760 type:complete len:279 (-) Transcript_36116:723-1559(-)